MPTLFLGTSVIEFFLALRLKEYLFVRHAFVRSSGKDADHVLVDQICMGKAVNRNTINEMVITQETFLGETEVLEDFN